jgi:hypothetical protein
MLLSNKGIGLSRKNLKIKKQQDQKDWQKIKIKKKLMK